MFLFQKMSQGRKYLNALRKIPKNQNSKDASAPDPPRAASSYRNNTEQLNVNNLFTPSEASILSNEFLSE